MIQLDLIGLVVRDMSAALAFYRLLGIDVPAVEGEDHVEATLPNGLRLAWDTVELMKSIHEQWVEPVGHRIGLAFLCETAAAVDETYERITAAGYAGHKAPWDAFWGQRYAVVVDPDGNLIDLFANL